MDNKPNIELMFSSQFPEENKEKVLSLFSDKFTIQYSPKEVMFHKTLGQWIAVGISLGLDGIRKFIEGFCEESGKQAARKLFELTDEVNINIEVDASIDVVEVAKNEEELAKIAEKVKDELEKKAK